MGLDKTGAAAKRLNLVYIFADQLRHDVFGYRGDKKAITPNFDSLAGQGASFGNCTSVTPVCAAYRASLFTGKYTSSTGMVINETCVNPNHSAIGYILHDAGYRTGYLGKWHLVDLHTRSIPPGPARLGFQHADLCRMYNFNHQNYSGYYWEDLDGAPQRHEIDGCQTFAWTDMALEFIRSSANSDQPFALFLSYSPAHDPWNKENVPAHCYERFRDVPFPNPPNFTEVPDPYADRFNTPEFWERTKPLLEEWRRGYYAMVNLLDDELGRIMKALKDAGVENDTILIYTSDHGEMLGSHGRIQKLTFYEEAARVPFLVRWPGRVPDGQECDACINTPDIAPTVLGFLGIETPEEMEGTDLSLRALGEPGPEPEFAFLQGMGHTYQWIDGSEWRAVRTKRHTYARYLRDGSEHLYDNTDDPCQTRNLASDPGAQTILRTLRDAMSEKMQSLNDEFKPCTWYRDHWMAADDPYSVTANAYGPFQGPYDAVRSLRAKVEREHV